MSLEDRYYRYCAFCWLVGTEPRSLDWWLRFSNDVPGE